MEKLALEGRPMAPATEGKADVDASSSHVELRSLRDLEARLAASVGPDRRLDLELACIHMHRPPEHFLNDELGRLSFGDQRHYTGSLEAAMTLATGWLFDLESCRTENGDQYKWNIWRPAGPKHIMAGPRRDIARTFCLALIRARIYVANATAAPAESANAAHPQSISTHAPQGATTETTPQSSTSPAPTMERDLAI